MAETAERRPAGEAGGAQDGGEHVKTRIAGRGCPGGRSINGSQPGCGKEHRHGGRGHRIEHCRERYPGLPGCTVQKVAGDYAARNLPLGNPVLIRCDGCEGWHEYGHCDELLCWCGRLGWAHSASQDEAGAA